MAKTDYREKDGQIEVKEEEEWCRAACTKWGSKRDGKDRDMCVCSPSTESFQKVFKKFTYYKKFKPRCESLVRMRCTS